MASTGLEEVLWSPTHYILHGPQSSKRTGETCINTLHPGSGLLAMIDNNATNLDHLVDIGLVERARRHLVLVDPSRQEVEQRLHHDISDSLEVGLAAETGAKDEVKVVVGLGRVSAEHVARCTAVEAHIAQLYASRTQPRLQHLHDTEQKQELKLLKESPREIRIKTIARVSKRNKN